MPIPFIVHVHMMYMCVPTHSVDHSMFPIGSVHYENNDYMLKVLNSSEQFLVCNVMYADNGPFSVLHANW